jgi:hypothetical protein
MCPGCISNLAMAVMSIGLTSTGGIAALVWRHGSFSSIESDDTEQEPLQSENKEQSSWQQAL